MIRKMSELKNSELIDDSESDTESIDPFPDRRLSEVVAQMLDSDPETDEKDDENEYDPFENQEEILTAFIDYKEEPKNKELFRGPLPSIEESDLEDAFACDNEVFVNKNGKRMSCDNQIISSFDSNNCDLRTKSNSYSEISTKEYDQHIRTIIGTRTETVFGVSLPKENTESEGCIKCRSETEFGVDTEFKDLRFRWSVTSV